VSPAHTNGGASPGAPGVQAATWRRHVSSVRQREHSGGRAAAAQLGTARNPDGCARRRAPPLRRVPPAGKEPRRRGRTGGEAGEQHGRGDGVTMARARVHSGARSGGCSETTHEPHAGEAPRPSAPARRRGTAHSARVAGARLRAACAARGGGAPRGAARYRRGLSKLPFVEFVISDLSNLSVVGKSADRVGGE
jgi:hypothetical protein